MQTPYVLQATHAALSIIVLGVLTSYGGIARATQCGSSSFPFPFTDVANVGDAFCPGILEAYVLGVTRGTTATTFTPNEDVTRLQMTTFLQRSIDQGLKRSNRRAALGQWWTPKTERGLQAVDLGVGGPLGLCKSDGDWVWIAYGDRYKLVHVPSGTEHGQPTPISFTNDLLGVVIANGRVYMTQSTLGAGGLATIERRYEPDFVSGFFGEDTPYVPVGVAFDGNRLWTANYANGTVSIIPLAANGRPTIVETLSAGGFASPLDILYDGTSMWVTDQVANVVRKLGNAGGIVQSIPVGVDPGFMTFDGANLWVPSLDGTVTVVQASSGAIVATITSNPSNRLSGSQAAAFDGERILVTNVGNDSVTLFRAADLSLIGNIQLAVGSQPIGACSDGVNFWVTLRGTRKLLRI